jgi:hypothetical protein
VKLFRSKTKNDHISPDYAQNSSIGFSSPGGQFDYEFLIMGRRVPGALNQILSIFLENKLDLLAIHSNKSSNDGKTFRLSICCNLEHSNIDPPEFCAILRKLGFVVGVEYSELESRLFGRARFPLTFFGRERALALRSDALIKLGMRLSREAGSAGTMSLYEGGRSYAKEIVEEIKKILFSEVGGDAEGSTGAAYATNSDPTEGKVQAYCVKCRKMIEPAEVREVVMRNGRKAIQGQCQACSTRVFKIGTLGFRRTLSSPIIDNVQGFLMASGFGTFELRKEPEGKRGCVTILNPPVVNDPSTSADIPYGNQFVEGIAAGLLESILGSPNEMKLVGERYLPDKKILDLHFAEYIPLISSKEKTSPPKAIGTRSQRARRKVTRTNKEVRLPQIEPISSLAAPEVYQEVERIVRSLEQIETQTREPVLDDGSIKLEKTKKEELEKSQEQLVVIEEKSQK